MRSTRLIVIISMILIVLLVSSPLQASEKLQIRIWTDKGTFFVKEFIPVNYEIKNVSDSVLFMSFLALEEYFVIQDKTDRFYNTQSRGYYGGGDSLQPQQSHSGWLNITDSYGITEAGEYTCFIKMPSGGFFPYTGTQSNVIKITIKSPEGNEKKALDLYLEAQKLHWCKDKDPEKWEQAFYKYLELVDKYPESVYAPLSLHKALLKAHVIKDKNVVISVCKKLIENYPESYYVDYTFLDLIENYKILGDKAGAMDYLKELIKRYPNTRTSKGAEYWLEKIEKQEFK